MYNTVEECTKRIADLEAELINIRGIEDSHQDLNGHLQTELSKARVRLTNYKLFLDKLSYDVTMFLEDVKDYFERDSKYYKNEVINDDTRL